MRNLIRTAVISAVMAWGGGAAALEGSLSTDTTLGSCTIKMVIDASQQWARVELAAAPPTEYFSGGTQWYNDIASGGFSPITPELIGLCLGIGSVKVTALSQKGADADSFAAQTYMGLSFSLAAGNYTTNDVNYVAGGTYPFYIGTPNSAPTANAGPDQTSVASVATVTLDGSGSTDPDAGDTLTYAWTQTSGTTMTLSSTTADKPTFTAPTLNIGDAAATLVFSLTVNDGTVDSTADTVSITVNAPSVTTANAPSDLVATAGDGQVSIAFTAPSNDGGADITDYQYELDDSGTWTSASTATSPVVITGLTNGTAYSIKLRAVNSAGNGTESAAVTATTPSPASEFAAKEDAIRSVITDDAQRSLSSTLASNRRLARDARERFLTSREQMQSDGAGLASCNNEALDVDGTAVASAGQIATQGNFFAQTCNFEGTQRRLVSGDFDVQRDGDTGSTTATINGKVAWEQMLSEQTMLGYYLGGEVSRSNIKGSFTGTKDAYGVSVGGYFVHALQENLFLDGFASLGAGRNDLEMADDTLALTSDYTTQTTTLGAAVSGVIEQTGYDILPELSVTYGKTTIGNVGFTGVAYGLTDDTLSLDAGSLSTATIMFRPEFRVPMDGLAASESSSIFSFAPRVMCERVKVASTTNNCGSGAELGISSSSSNGLTSLNTTIIADRVGTSTRRSLQFNLQHKF